MASKRANIRVLLQRCCFVSVWFLLQIYSKFECIFLHVDILFIPLLLLLLLCRSKPYRNSLLRSKSHTWKCFDCKNKEVNKNHSHTRIFIARCYALDFKQKHAMHLLLMKRSIFFWNETVLIQTEIGVYRLFFQVLYFHSIRWFDFSSSSFPSNLSIIQNNLCSFSSCNFSKSI